MPHQTSHEEVLYEVNGFWLNFQHAETETEFIMSHTKNHCQAPLKVFTFVWAIIVTAAYVSNVNKSGLHLERDTGCNFEVLSE